MFAEETASHEKNNKAEKNEIVMTGKLIYMQSKLQWFCTIRFSNVERERQLDYMINILKNKFL